MSCTHASLTHTGIRTNATMKAVLAQLKEQEAEILKEHREKLSGDADANALRSFEFAEVKVYQKKSQNTGSVARSFTSTGNRACACVVHMHGVCLST
jgi:hypothetical protein